MKRKLSIQSERNFALSITKTKLVLDDTEAFEESSLVLVEQYLINENDEFNAEYSFLY